MLKKLIHTTFLIYFLLNISYIYPARFISHRIQNMQYNFPLNGKFGNFGGKYIPETLIPAIEELEQSYQKYNIGIIGKIQYMKRNIYEKIN